MGHVVVAVGIPVLVDVGEVQARAHDAWDENDGNAPGIEGIRSNPRGTNVRRVFHVLVGGDAFQQRRDIAVHVARGRQIHASVDGNGNTAS
jgi:hypothetical protein